MSTAFGSPAIDLHPDQRCQEQRPAEPEPHIQAVPDPVPESVSEQVTVVVGEGLGAWVERKLAGQPWWAEPQPSIRSLVEHAQAVEWTTSDWARNRRVAWLYAVTVPVRLGSWSLLRVWLRTEAPQFGAGQPPIRDVIRRARESGAPAMLWVCGAYLPARIASQIADYATRTGVALLMMWLLVNAAGFPEKATAGYWVEKLVALVSNMVSGTTTAAHDAMPAAEQTGEVAVMAIAAIVGVAVLVMRRRNKQKNIRG